MTAVATGLPRFSSERAEGTQSGSDAREAASPVVTTTVPTVRISTNSGAPTAETGMVAAAHIPTCEGIDRKDTQDASRTTAQAKTILAPQAPARTHTPTVLIVEDSIELAEIIEATLQRLDIVTAHETHGNKALERFQLMKPDVVLLDIGLPDMMGWKLLDDIKERYGEANLPAVVVITAYGDPANRLVGKLQDVRDYLIKPFTADEVERVVTGALGSAVS
ncbi:MAG: response regulator [Aggregatilineales bacterium]